MVDCYDLHMFQFVCLLLFGQVQIFCSASLSCVPFDRAEVDVTVSCSAVSCNLLVTESSKSSVSVFRMYFVIFKLLVTKNPLMFQFEPFLS